MSKPSYPSRPVTIVTGYHSHTADCARGEVAVAVQSSQVSGIPVARTDLRWPHARVYRRDLRPAPRRPPTTPLWPQIRSASGANVRTPIPATIDNLAIRCEISETLQKIGCPRTEAASSRQGHEAAASACLWAKRRLNNANLSTKANTGYIPRKAQAMITQQLPAQAAVSGQNQENVMKEGQGTFLDCPAWQDQDGAVRCGLPAEVKSRYTMRSSGGPLESVMIRCPSGHWFNGPIEFLKADSKQKHPQGNAVTEVISAR